MDKIILKIQDLSINLKQRNLIHIKELVLKEKQIIGIYAPNGSGKSTLLNVIAKLSLPEDFEVKGEIEIQSDVSYVFQKPVLIESKSVEKNILISLNSVDDKTEKKDLCRKWIQFLDLTSVMNKKVKNLSGGERQRVCIARAFASKSKLMLLDEPFASQDEENSKRILGLLKEEKEKNALSAILVSHDLEKLKKICDFIVYLEYN